MKLNNQVKQGSRENISLHRKQYTYQELIEYLDKNWLSTKNSINLDHITSLDRAFNNPSHKLTSIMLAGTNGKSITAHFTGRLFKEEGLLAGTFLSPHLLNYNERMSVKGETISNKLFTEIGNEVFTEMQSQNLQTDSLTILTMMSFLYFERANIDIAIFELSRTELYDDPCTIITPEILGITRLSDHEIKTNEEKITAIIEKLGTLINSKTHIVAADQNKQNLQSIETMANQHGATWHMAIRKIVPLTYPFEQLHGRCAALAKRIASIFINERIEQNEIIVNTSLLAKQKGRRGRPTLEAKRLSELQPKKTLDLFWKDAVNLLPGRFQLLEKEKPTILLDIASNLDAIKNILLGIRLLHYQRPIKGLTLILGFTELNFDQEEFFKTMRYFFKKTSGQIIICQTHAIPGHGATSAFDCEQLAQDLKAMKIKVRCANSLEEAFDLATVNIDERQGMIMLTGSPAIVSNYLQYKQVNNQQ